MLGKKLKVKKDCNIFTEITGVYPIGQLGYTETHYELLLAGKKMKLPESLIGELFEEDIPEEVKLPPVEEVVVKLPEKVKKVKKAKKAKNKKS